MYEVPTGPVTFGVINKKSARFGKKFVLKLKVFDWLREQDLNL
jgi:hypothetical protein